MLLWKTRVLPKKKNAADILKESAEDTLTTNAINHPENKEVVGAVIENVPQEKLEDVFEEAEQELEDIEQENAQIQRSSVSQKKKDESAELVKNL